MSDGSDHSRLKSAYELALEQLDSAGIARPDRASVSAETRRAVADARSRAEAKLAELEILHRQQLSEIVDPAGRQQAEDEYRSERSRIEARRDREIDALRSSAGHPAGQS